MRLVTSELLNPCHFTHLVARDIHYYKSWFFKRFKLTNLSFFTNGHVHLTKGQGFE
jgi:hypothetical protein